MRYDPGGGTPGEQYRRGRQRLIGLAEDLDETDWLAPVPACPGWRVRDVVAHLFGNVEDVAAGRLSGPPSPAQTQDQVARHAGDDPRELLQAWDAAGGLVEAAITESSSWPAVIDLVSHEHDVRGALDRPGAREDESIRFLARLLVADLVGSGRLDVELDGEPVGAGAVDSGLVVRTTSFEMLRLRMGRRSVAQVRALDWSADPSAVLDELFVFGPAAHDLVE